MALPQLRCPVGPFLRDTHEIETISLYANTPMQTGAAIRRRRWVSAPRYANVVLEVDQTGMDAWDEWHEGPLKAGVEKFSAEIQNQGPGLLWWSCRFMEPYTVEYLGGLWWRIDAKLMLFDAGSVDPPVPTTLVGSVRIGLQATAVLVAEQPLSGSVTISLLAATTVEALSGSAAIALEAATYVPPLPTASASGSSTASGVSIGSEFLREVGSVDKMLREDGFKILRE